MARHLYALFPLGKKGVWQRIIEAGSRDKGVAALFIDSTVVRAYQHAAGAQALGRPRGGLSTKIHTAVRPAAGRNWPEIHCNSVVLPEPDSRSSVPH